MTDVDPVRVYLDARAEYDRARAGSGQLLDLVARVLQSARNDPGGLLVQHLKLSPPPSIHTGRRATGYPAAEIGRWPDLNALVSAFKETHAAHLRMHEAWGRLTDQDRQTLSASGPQDLSLQ